MVLSVNFPEEILAISSQTFGLFGGFQSCFVIIFFFLLFSILLAFGQFDANTRYRLFGKHKTFELFVAIKYFSIFVHLLRRRHA